MSHPFDHLFGSGSQPLRRDASVKATHDAAGNPVFEVVDGEVISLSPDGSVDRTRVAGFFHCGHSTQEGVGGHCAEPDCRNVSCKHCFAQARCCYCLKPLCLEHVRQLRTETETLSLCDRCLNELRHKRFWRAIGRRLLKPFARGEPRDTA